MEAVISHYCTQILELKKKFLLRCVLILSYVQMCVQVPTETIRWFCIPYNWC